MIEEKCLQVSGIDIPLTFYHELSMHFFAFDLKLNQ